MFRFRKVKRNNAENPFIYRPMHTGEETVICEFVIRVFDEFIKLDYSQEGINEFYKYIQPSSLLKRFQENHFVLVALFNDIIIGVIEIRNCNHISLLFVDGCFQRKGVSRELLKRSLKLCLRKRSDLTTISVNSSPIAVNIYMKLGFIPQDKELVSGGIRYTPMKKIVNN